MKAAKARNRLDRAACTATAEVFRPNGRPRARASAPPKTVITRHHSSSEPSWLPQAPATLYSNGLSVWLFRATFETEKSETTKA
ncbi:hypothetical protein D3C73_1171230 [compost metagenome]